MLTTIEAKLVETNRGLHSFKQKNNIIIEPIAP